eukprot:scaffold18638_cov21-Tisochrysis_lutea.AAC.1
MVEVDAVSSGVQGGGGAWPMPHRHVVHWDKVCAAAEESVAWPLPHFETLGRWGRKCGDAGHRVLQWGRMRGTAKNWGTANALGQKLRQQVGQKVTHWRKRVIASLVGQDVGKASTDCRIRAQNQGTKSFEEQTFSRQLPQNCQSRSHLASISVYAGNHPGGFAGTVDEVRGKVQLGNSAKQQSKTCMVGNKSELTPKQTPQGMMAPTYAGMLTPRVMMRMVYDQNKKCFEVTVTGYDGTHMRGYIGTMDEVGYIVQLKGGEKAGAHTHVDQRLPRIPPVHAREQAHVCVCVCACARAHARVGQWCAARLGRSGSGDAVAYAHALEVHALGALLHAHAPMLYAHTPGALLYAPAPASGALLHVRTRALGALLHAHAHALGAMKQAHALTTKLHALITMLHARAQ